MDASASQRQPLKEWKMDKYRFGIFPLRDSKRAAGRAEPQQVPSEVSLPPSEPVSSGSAAKENEPPPSRAAEAALVQKVAGFPQRSHDAASARAGAGPIPPGVGLGGPTLLGRGARAPTPTPAPPLPPSPRVQQRVEPQGSGPAALGAPSVAVGGVGGGFDELAWRRLAEAEAERRDEAEQLRRRLAHEEELRAAAENELISARAVGALRRDERRADADEAVQAMHERFRQIKQELRGRQPEQKHWQQGEAGLVAVEEVAHVFAKQLAEQLKNSIDASKRQSGVRRSDVADRGSELRMLREELAASLEQQRALQVEAANAVAGLDLLGAHVLDDSSSAARAHGEIRELQERCRSLAERAEHAEAAHKQAAKCAIDFEDQVTTLSQELDECQDRCLHEQAVAKAQTRELDIVTAEMEQAKMAVRASQLNEAELKLRCDGLVVRLDELALRSQAAAESEARAQACRVALEDRAEALERELTACKSRELLHAAQASVEDRRISDMMIELESARAGRNESLQHEAHIKQASARQAELESQIQVQALAMAASDEELGKIREALRVASSALEAAKAREEEASSAAKATEEQAHEQASRLGETIRGLEEELAAAKGEADAAVAAAKAEIEQRAEEFREARDADASVAGASEAAAQEAMAALRGRVASLEAELHAANIKAEEAAAAASSAGDEITRLKADVHKARVEGDDAAAAAASAMEEIAMLQTRLLEERSAAAASATDAGASAERFGAEFRQLREEALAAQQQQRESDARASRLEAELAQANQYLQEAAIAAANDEEEAQKLNAEIETLREAMSSSRADASGLKEHLATLQQDLEQAREQARAAAEGSDQAQALSVAIEAEREKLQTARTELREARAEARRLEEAHGAATAQAAWLRRENEEFKSKMAQCESALSSEKRISEELDGQVTQLKEELAGSRQQHEACAAHVAAQAAAAETAAAARRELEAELADARQRLEALADTDAAADQLRSQLADAVLRRDESQAECIRVGAHAKALEQQLCDLRSRQERHQAEAKQGSAAWRWALFADRAVQVRMAAAMVGAESVELRQRRRTSAAVGMRLMLWAGRLAEIVRRRSLAKGLRDARREDAQSYKDFAGRLDTKLETVYAEKLAAQQAAETATAQKEETQRELEALKADRSAEQAAEAKACADQLQIEVSRYQGELREMVSEQEYLRMQVEDLGSCDVECEALRSSSRELLRSVQHLKEENELLEADNQRLKEAMAIFEGDVDDLTHRNAQLIGHTNTKQKLRYTMKLKEDCYNLRSELQKARTREAQLEGALRHERMLRSAYNMGSDSGGLGLAKRHGSVSCSPPVRCSSPTPHAPATASSAGAAFRGAMASGAVAGLCLLGASPEMSLTTPRRPGSTSAPVRRSAGRAAAQVAQETSAVQRREHEHAMRRLRLAERAVEKSSIDRQHVIAMVARAVLRSSGEAAAEGGAADLSEVLRRLRSGDGDVCGGAADESAAQGACGVEDSRSGQPAIMAAPHPPLQTVADEVEA